MTTFGRAVLRSAIWLVLGVCVLLDAVMVAYLASDHVVYHYHPYKITVTPTASHLTLTDWALLAGFVFFQGLFVLAVIRFRCE